MRQRLQTVLTSIEVGNVGASQRKHVAMKGKVYVYVLGRFSSMNRKVPCHSSMAGLRQEADGLQATRIERIGQSHPVEWHRA